MAAYDYSSGGFPSSPATNDTLTINGTSYIYDGSKWKVVGANGLTSSATAPSSPTVGDQWFNTTTGVLSTYMTDGNDSDWLDISSANGLAAASSGGGAMEFISKSTVSSNVTSVDFTSLSGYSTYKIIFDCHSTSSAFLNCRIYDGGSLVTGDGAYDSRIRYNGSNSTGQSQAHWYLDRGDAGNKFGEATFTVSSDRVNVRAITGATTGSDVFVGNMTGGTDPTVDSIGSFDGIRIYPANNNITSGTFTLYGIKDS
jgi:hypothetical protein